MNISYVIAIHNEEKEIGNLVHRLVSQLSSSPFNSRVYLVENGSKDQTYERAKSSASQYTSARTPIRVSTVPMAGLGYGLRQGMVEALADIRHDEERESWLLLTAVDLPFGFSDLDGFLRQAAEGKGRIACGSKAHPDSKVDAPAFRRVMSTLYYWVRRILLGIRIKDTQGSCFIRADLARQILPNLTSGGFFFSTEVCYRALEVGEQIAEVPVQLQRTSRQSKVRPFRDGLRMIRSSLRLRVTGKP